MSMYKNFTDIINVLNFDEDLLRLLYYSPANLVTNIPDPLDRSLQNILDMDEEVQWNIRNERIMLTDKTDDLVPDNPICRLFIYPGKRVGNEYVFADQQIIIDILCHHNFENGDLRSTRIADRLNDLFVNEKITGIGKTKYVNGTPWGSPKEYTAYRHVFQFGSFSK